MRNIDVNGIKMVRGVSMDMIFFLKCIIYGVFLIFKYWNGYFVYDFLRLIFLE